MADTKETPLGSEAASQTGSEGGQTVQLYRPPPSLLLQTLLCWSFF